MENMIVVHASDYDWGWIVAVCDTWDEARKLAVADSVARLDEEKKFREEADEGELPMLPMGEIYRGAPTYLLYEVAVNAIIGDIPKDATVIRWGYDECSTEYEAIMREHLYVN
jgi:hypothetical protein